MPHTMHNDPERGLALQKYLLLHSQHDALQKHLTHITPIPSIPIGSSSRSQSPDHHRYTSLSSSPSSCDESSFSSPPTSIRHYRGSSIPRQRPQIRTRRSSLPTVIDESIIGEIEEEESKLKSVNQQIKTTLTDLLNCESVRGDPRYRMWVQTRLMDAERELKGSRTRSCERRRSEDMGGLLF